MNPRCQAQNKATCRRHHPELRLAEFTTPSTKPKTATVLLAGKEVPLKSFTTVHHVGSLNASQKKAESYEGQGLSFSLNPEEWQQIARLSGETWTLQKPGNKFLNYHKLTKAQRTAITEYGLEKGYIQETTSYRIVWWDDEADAELSMEFPTREEVEEEIMDPDETTVTTHTTYMSTDAFPDITVKTGSTNVHGILTAVWVNETQPGLDGVWWQDKLDVARLSAPRGVIVPNKISSWLNSSQKS
jgi:hypothetical protein